MKRKVTSISFPLKSKGGKKKHKIVSISFNDSETFLYKKVSSLSASQIRKIIAIYSYEHLKKVADKEKCKLSQLIKIRLKEKLYNKKISKRISFDPEKVNKWIKNLKKKYPNKELIDFLNNKLLDESK